MLCCAASYYPPYHPDCQTHLRLLIDRVIGWRAVEVVGQGACSREPFLARIDCIQEADVVANGRVACGQ